MTYQARTNVCAVTKDLPNNAHAYRTTKMASPTLETTITLPLRAQECLSPFDFTSQSNEDADHESLSLELQPGFYDKSEQLDIDKFPSSSATEDNFQFNGSARKAIPGKDSPLNNTYQASNCDPYSPESLHRIGMKLMVTVPYESVYGPTTNPNAPKYVEVPLETITNDGRKRSLQIDGGVYLPPPSRYGTAPTGSNYNPYKPSPWSPTQPVYLARTGWKDTT